MKNYHKDPMFFIRASRKTIDDFSYLPGNSQKERFERVVTLGLKMAEQTNQVPARPIQTGVIDKRAIMDNIAARFNQPAPVPIQAYSTGKTLADFPDEEIIAYQRTWNRKRSLPAIHMFLQRAAEEDWQI